MSNKVVIDLDKLVKPRTLIDESRAKELVAGMIRLSADEETEIPTEWIEEYREIAERYPVLKLEETADDTENPDDSGNSGNSSNSSNSGDSGNSGDTGNDDSGNTDGSDNTDNTDGGGNNG